MREDAYLFYAFLFLLLMVVAKAAAIPVFVVFMILKLCGVVSWAWWLVCIPLYVFGAIVLFGQTLRLIDYVEERRCK